MNHLEPVSIVTATMLYFYNTDPQEQITVMLGHQDLHPSYMKEWIERYRAGLSEFYGRMSTDTRIAYVTAAIKSYGAQAVQELAMFDARRDQPS